MIDINKSIEESENDYWGEPALDSYVIATCHKARQKPIKLLSNEEIRCLIGQKTGLRYLLQAAVDILQNDPLIEVTYFEGDLLLELLRLDIADWQDNESERERFTAILRSNRLQIEMCGEIAGGLLEKYI